MANWYTFGIESPLPMILTLNINTAVGPTSVFFLAWKKSGRESLFLPIFRFFHGQNEIFTCVFFGFFHFFHARNWFSRANFWFSSRPKKLFHAQKNENFHGHFFRPKTAVQQPCKNQFAKRSELGSGVNWVVSGARICTKKWPCNSWEKKEREAPRKKKGRPALWEKRLA